MRVRCTERLHRGRQKRYASRQRAWRRARPQDAQVLLGDLRVWREVDDDAVASRRTFGVDVSNQRSGYAGLAEPDLVRDKEPSRAALPLVERRSCALRRDALERAKTGGRSLREGRHSPSSFRVESHSSTKSSGSWSRLASTR